MKNQGQNPIFLKDYSAPNYLVETIDLHVDLFEEDTVVTSTIEFKRNPAHPGKANLVLHGEEHQIKFVKINGNEMDSQAYEKSEDKLIIPNVPDAFTLEIQTIIQPQHNTTLSGLYRSESMFCTQCESEGFRRITYYPDRPDVMAKFTTTIVADKKAYPVLLSNGNCVGKGEANNGRHWVKWADPFKKPSYLFAMVAGDLLCIKDTFTTQSGKEVALELFVEPENKEKCDHAMESLKKSMAWDEQTYGLEYDLDIYMIVAVNDFNMGAMENKGLNIFNSKYVLANKQTATDHDFQGVESVIGHEYFHNWTGNRVTCRDWFQLSLKEGLTVFREQQFSASCGSAGVKRIEDVRLIRSRQFAEDAGPMAHPVRPESYIEINNFYTMTVYYKGSEVIRMMHTLLGNEGFRKGMDLYFKRHDGQAVTCDDFVAAMSDANQFDLSQFTRWYSQAGTPEVTVTTEYDASAQQLRVHLSQSTKPTADQSEKKPFYMPVRLGILSKEGQSLPVQSTAVVTKDQDSAVVIFNEAKQSYVFENVSSEPVISIFRDFSAPVKVHQALSMNDLRTLMLHDTDSFNRWDASQAFALTQIEHCMQATLNDKEYEIPSDVFEAYQTLLQSDLKDKAVIAQMLTLPDFHYLCEVFDNIHVAALLAGIDKMHRQIAYHCQDDFLKVYQSCASADDGSQADWAVENRALKNCALMWLGKLNDDQALEMAIAQYDASDNMTDTMAAMAALRDNGHEKKLALYEGFYETWQHDPLVVNKWLGLQATAKTKDTLKNVKALLKHPGFSMSNPNKVYALIGGFSHNPWHFHADTGEGYAFLADLVINLNKQNPQVASRMLEPLTQFGKLDIKWASLMKKALQRISQEPKLSPDVYELVSKSLNQGDSDDA